MFTRVVRFTDVDPERMDALIARIDESEGPPQGVNTTGLTIVRDADQRTAVVLQHFATAADMEAAAAVFSAMDSGDTPGTRASVDMGEVKLELTMP